jgi:AmmeMemoRadiSam system protein B
MTIRAPAVAGSFYPDDAAELSGMVDRLLAEAAPPSVPFRVAAVIAPHAGYGYSGPVAASAFASLRQAGPAARRVVVIGPSHHLAFRGLALPRRQPFRTPLGDVPLDREAVTALAALPHVVLDDEPHLTEHAIEVELPFLQRLLGDFTLVPLVVGTATAVEVAQVLEQVWDPETTLVVASSDLSHYYAHATAERLDGETALRIEALAGDELGPEQACGWLAVAGLLRLARAHGLTPLRLDLRTSGDTAGDRSRVVGYGAWAFGSPAA